MPRTTTKILYHSGPAKTLHTVIVLAVFPKGSPVGQSGVLWSGVPGDCRLQLCDLHRHWVQGDSGLQERRLCIRFISLCLGPLDWGRDGQVLLHPAGRGFEMKSRNWTSAVPNSFHTSQYPAENPLLATQSSGRRPAKVLIAVDCCC